jgi:hypothetical protein
VALPDTDEDWVAYLTMLHERERSGLKELDREYELDSPRAYMHPEIMRELGDRLQQVVIAWPLLVVDSVEERLDVEGFRLPSQDAGDDDMWRVWQENSCDEESQLAHVDALVMKRSYIAVGANEDDPDTPLVTFESPLEVFADVDPRTRRVTAALRRWRPDTPTSTQGSLARANESFTTLYLPDHTVYFENGREVDRDEHGLGVVPIVPLVNRSRLSDRWGRSELKPILPLAHAANKIATDMMVAAEFVALPLRGIFGIGPADLEDADGNKLTALQAILGRLLTIPNDDGRGQAVRVHLGQPDELPRDDQPAGQAGRLDRRPAAARAGLRHRQPGLRGRDPLGEARLVKRAERKQRAFGGAHEQAMRLVRRIQVRRLGSAASPPGDDLAGRVDPDEVAGGRRHGEAVRRGHREPPPGTRGPRLHRGPDRPHGG